jgi:hypothetical protein
MRLNCDAHKLKKGNKVTTDYDPSASDVVRTITKINKDARYGSGYRASADRGPVCSGCGRPYSSAIRDVDAAWFIPAPGGEG